MAAELPALMKAKLVDRPPVGEGWIFEIKFDGFRALAVKRGKTVALVSRNNKPLTQRFPELLPALAALRVKEAVVDGEIVAVDEVGRTSFQLLQAADVDPERPPLCFYAFDLLRVDGEDLRGLPLMERKARLAEIIGEGSETLRFSGNLPGEPAALLAEIKKLGLEGLIGKKRESRYESGGRSGSWIKLKVVNEQEFVIGGYTEPQGARSWFGALLVGVYEKGELIFASKIGTGFNEKSLRALYAQFQPMRRETCPLVNLPVKRGGRWGQGITRAEMKRCTWLEPKLVCQAKFTEWTRDGNLRHPVFLGLREDKRPREVVREG